jgi:hypothetical protein
MYSLNCGLGNNLFSRTESHMMAQTSMTTMTTAAVIMTVTVMMTVTLFKQQIFESLFRAVVSVGDNRE